MHDAHLSWCVDDGNEFLEMPANETVVEDPVLILQALEERVLPERVIARFELVVGPIALLIEGVDRVGEASREAKCLALSDGKPGALVPSGAGKNGIASEGDTILALRAVGHECSDER